MTKSELLKALKSCPADTPIMAIDANGEYVDIDGLKLVDLAEVKTESSSWYIAAKCADFYAAHTYNAKIIRTFQAIEIK